MKRELIGKIECYYVNKGSGSWISYNAYPDRVGVLIYDKYLAKKFYKETPFPVFNDYIFERDDDDAFCDWRIEIQNYEGGFLNWLKKWMKENHVYFERTDYNKPTCTTTEIRYYEYDYK